MGQYDSLDKVLKDIVSGDKPHPTGMVVIARNSNGDVLYQGSSGTHLTDQTKGRVFSASKLIAPVILLQHVEDGLFGLDDPVMKYVEGGDFLYDKVLAGFDDQDKPILEPVKNPLTFRQLGDHTGGIPYLFPGSDLIKYYNVGMAQAEVMHFKNKYAKGPLAFQPGTDFTYGQGLGAAGLVLHHITGKDLDELLQERIVKPLKLKNTTFRWYDDDRKIYGFRDTPMDFSSGWHLDSITEGTAEEPLGDVTLVTNAEEYSIMLAEILKATQGKPNRLFKNAETGKQLLTDKRLNEKATSSLQGFLGFVLGAAPWFKELKEGDMTFGLGYCMNLVDLPTGRPKGCGFWEGYTGPAGIVSPKEDVALHMYQLLVSALDPASRDAQFRVESEFWKCFRSGPSKL